MKTEDFFYELPEELIAQHPLSDRSSSKLLLLDKNTGEIQHRIFNSIGDFLNKGDCLVINDTRVMPVRLYGKKTETGGKIELLLLKRKDTYIWETLVKPGKNAKLGNSYIFSDELKGTIIEVLDNGNRLIKFEFDGIFEEILDRLGEMPLPPYIHEKLEDKERYQTVYATHNGSSAAPTAGLHFTDALLEELTNKGIKIARITLHVGLGTFRPVQVDDVENHQMHSEEYVVSEEAAKIINETKKSGKRIISIGTTSCRTLESVSDDNGVVHAGRGNTDIFIYPGYKFKVIDGLITNFHLPESTLVMLVSALSKKEYILNAYNIAVENKYRFFSFGDVMFIH